jgi:hypothetical protein
MDYVWIETDLYDLNAISQYAYAIYHSILILSGGDIGPRGNFQIFFITILLLASAIINANIFGNIAVILQQMNRKATKFQEKMESATSTMENLDLPDKLQKKIQEYLTYTHSTLDQQNELDSFLLQLSPSLKLEVRNVLMKGSISKDSVFDNNKYAIDAVLRDLSILLFMPEDIIIKQGTEGQTIYFIAVGECAVFVTNEKRKVQSV